MSVTTLREKLVSIWRAVTVAPETTEPLASRIVPRIVPVGAACIEGTNTMESRTLLAKRPAIDNLCLFIISFLSSELRGRGDIPVSPQRPISNQKISATLHRYYT